MQKVYFLTFFLLSSFIVAATGVKEESSPVEVQKEFIGILKYIEYTPFDTTYFKVYVSNDKIRVDSFDNKNTTGDANKITIYNLKEHNILALKPSAQIYKMLDIDFDNKDNIDGCEIILNPRNYKYINDYKCVQYRVKNRSENTDITYWIPEEDFPFYYEMISMKNSMHRVHKYFFMLPNYKVAFPMQTVERTLLREEKSSYKVIELDESEINAHVFDIPEGYTLNE